MRTHAAANAAEHFGPFLLAAACFVLMSYAAMVSAHIFGEQPGLIDLVAESDLVVRGTIARATHADGGFRVTALEVEKVLKNILPHTGAYPANKQRGPLGTISFVGDPNHGVRYAAGERVVVFLRRSPSGFVSPQLFGNKFRITSFNPTGYDRFIEEISAALQIHDERERSKHLRHAMRTGRLSHERRVRAAASKWP